MTRLSRSRVRPVCSGGAVGTTELPRSSNRPLGLVRRRHSPTPARNRCVLDDVIRIAGVVHRKTRTPFGVAHHCCPELRICRQARIISSNREQCDEPQALLASDMQSPMLGKHVLVAAQVIGVGGRTAHHLTPPGHDIASVLVAHLAAKQWCEQVVILDKVVNRPNHRSKAGRPPAQS
jgi:hypothetical protein